MDAEFSKLADGNPFRLTVLVAGAGAGSVDKRLGSTFTTAEYPTVYITSTSDEWITMEPDSKLYYQTGGKKHFPVSLKK